jgi:hypothetical protein
MSQKSDDINPFDPTGMFKSMRDTGMDAWSKIMIQVVSSDAYAQASSAMLDAWLTNSAPFRKAVETTMSQALTQLNMPTRADVTGIAERLTNIEMRLDDLAAKLDEGQSATPKAAPAKPKIRPDSTEKSA